MGAKTRDEGSLGKVREISDSGVEDRRPLWFAPSRAEQRLGCFPVSQKPVQVVEAPASGCLGFQDPGRLRWYLWPPELFGKGNVATCGTGLGLSGGPD